VSYSRAEKDLLEMGKYITAWSLRFFHLSTDMHRSGTRQIFTDKDWKFEIGQQIFASTKISLLLRLCKYSLLGIRKKCLKSVLVV
jgi:hypothetical protein